MSQTAMVSSAERTWKKARFSLAALPLNTDSSDPLLLFLATFLPVPTKRGSEIGKPVNYIFDGVFGRFVRGETFLDEKIPGAEFFWSPYLCIIRVSTEQPLVLG